MTGNMCYYTTVVVLLLIQILLSLVGKTPVQERTKELWRGGGGAFTAWARPMLSLVLALHGPVHLHQ